MKYETRIRAIKNDRGRVAVPQQAAQPSQRWLSHPVQIVLVAAVSAVVTYWLLNNLILSRLPTGIIGTWEIKHGELEGFTMEFFRNGTMRSRVISEGQLIVIDSDTSVDDDMLEETTDATPEIEQRQSFWQVVTSIFRPMQGTKQIIMRRIVSLTPSQLILETQDGIQLKFERVRR